MTNESKDIPDLLHLKMSSAKGQDLANKIARLLKDGTSDLADLLDRAIALKESEDATTAKKRKPGRFKGKLIVGPEFFEPLSDDELKELTGE